jgi:hypothetical protein
VSYSLGDVDSLEIDYVTPSDKLCKASPAVERAILESVAALQKEGHECIEFEPFDGIFSPSPRSHFVSV